ncbi:hypothetical protein WJX84_007979 [Apatococcus fuscideae]|uniref:BZIP domain-containing protein n=1 Tax=Apatococcus fuscideae TaxID=2026836 RepID=A0AAW1SPP1_9CHLO
MYHDILDQHCQHGAGLQTGSCSPHRLLDYGAAANGMGGGLAFLQPLLHTSSSPSGSHAPLERIVTEKSDLHKVLSDMGVPLLREDGSWGFSDPLASGSGSNTLPAADHGLNSRPLSPTHSPRLAPGDADAMLQFTSGSHAFAIGPFSGSHAMQEHRLWEDPQQSMPLVPPPVSCADPLGHFAEGALLFDETPPRVSITLSPAKKQVADNSQGTEGVRSKRSAASNPNTGIPSGNQPHNKRLRLSDGTRLSGHTSLQQPLQTQGQRGQLGSNDDMGRSLEAGPSQSLGPATSHTALHSSQASEGQDHVHSGYRHGRSRSGLRHKGEIPSRLASLLAQERSSSIPEDSTLPEMGGRRGSTAPSDHEPVNVAAAPSEIPGLQSQASLSIELSQYTEEDVEVDLPHNLTHQERELALKRARNRAAARRTRAKKQANVASLQAELRRAAQENDVLSAHVADLTSQADIAAKENGMLKTLLKCLTPCREGMRKQPALACLAFMKNSLASAPTALQAPLPISQGNSASSVVPLSMVPVAPSNAAANNSSLAPSATTEENGGSTANVQPSEVLDDQEAARLAAYALAANKGDPSAALAQLLSCVMQQQSTTS